MKKKQAHVFAYSFIAAFGGLVFGIDAANISGTVRFVTSQFELTSMQVGMFISCSILGVIFSLLFVGSLCNKFGRKRVLQAIAIAYLISSILSSFAPNYPILIIGRFIGGLAFTSLTICSMYIGEIASPTTRGKFVTLQQLLIGFGSLCAFVTNYCLVSAMPHTSWLTNTTVWRYMFAFELIPNAIWVILLFFIPQSPRWLIIKGREEKARKVFKAVTEDEEEVPMLVEAVKASLDHAKGALNTFEQLRVLFSPKMRTILTIAIVYAIVQTTSGMSAVLHYAPTVFEQIGMSLQDTFMKTIILGAVSVTATIVAMFFVEKMGRRFLTLAGLALVVIAHTSTWYGFHSATYHITEKAIQKIEAKNTNIDVVPLREFIGKVYKNDVELKDDLAGIYSQKQLPLVVGEIIKATITIQAFYVLFGLFAFIAAFGISIGPIMWVVLSEIFPNKIRSVALPFILLLKSMTGYTIQQFFPWQLEHLGAADTFLLYGGITFVGLVIMFFILPETKNKSLEVIEKQLIRA